ncbi:MAG: LysM peptidoglycan-binding domain-containing protein [Bacteroidales bacterium]|nr:LysM peptidoglycan-binding domain-containing protein [Bacteroidales bacterium]
MKRILIITMLLAASFVAKGQKLYDYSDVVSNGYDFLVYLPESYENSQEELPVILYLHGKSCTGTDINMVTKYGTITALRKGVDVNAIVIAPQVEIYKNGWEPKKVMAVMDYVTSNFRVDENRMYVVGMSMGGSGTYKVIGAYPDKFAAAITMCGTCWVDIKPIAKVPLWVIHGVDDTATPFSRSTDFVKKMEAANTTSRLRYSWLEGCGHSILARVYMLEKVYEWLFKHSLTDEGRPMSKEYDVTSDDLHNLYKNLKTKPKQIPIEQPNVEKKVNQEKKVDSEKKSEATKQQKASENVYHVIAEGDTMYKIAGKYGIKVSELCRLNNMQETDILQIGRKLLVKSKSTSTKQQTSTKPKQNTTGQYHTIEEGDTLYKIAGKYNTKVSELCRLNNIQETTILQIGMKLRVK